MTKQHADKLDISKITLENQLEGVKHQLAEALNINSVLYGRVKALETYIAAYDVPEAPVNQDNVSTETLEIKQ